MKLSSFSQVKQAIEERALLITKRNTCLVVVTVMGDRVDEDLLARVKPVVTEVLNERIAELEKDLAAFGVTLD